MKNKEDPKKGTLEPSQVLLYLQKNPNFFIENEEILKDINLTHKSGQAISLVERQVSILRNQSKTADEKFSELITNASNNDKIFHLVRDLVLQILKLSHASSIPKLIKSQFERIQGVDVCSVIIPDFTVNESCDNLRKVSIESLQDNFPEIFRLKKTFCGAISKDKKMFLFDDSSLEGKSDRNDIQQAKDKSNSGIIREIHSTAICPVIYENEVLGLIGCGSKDENHFSPTLETIFFDFIGEVIGAILSRK